MEDILSNLGISDTDLDTMCEQANEFMSGELMNVDENEGNIGETGTGSFLRNFFGNMARHRSPQNDKEGKRPEKAAGAPKPEKKFLNSFCVNLTERAQKGKLDALIGRDAEVEHALCILNRRLKNNPCLIGEPGVGKTAIVEGIATKIASGKAPAKLLHKEIWQLDMTALVAGTQYRGQMEGRMKGLLDEVKTLGNVILFIDEVHSIVGAGDAEGGMNAANILKPALSRGDIQVIGATTFTEYRKHIEKDSALERRFQPVTVEEPSVEDSVRIIKGVAGYYEQYHHVHIPPEMAEEAVRLSERYITDRFLPDKAIDLIDEACSGINLATPMCTKLERLTVRQNDLQTQAQSLMQGEVSPETEAKLSAIRKEADKVQSERAAIGEEALPTLTKEALAHVIGLWTGIPVGKINEKESARILSLEGTLKKRIIGQDAAVEALCRAIRRRRAGISGTGRPVSFLFSGPTGVGKTEVVKQLALNLYDGPDSLIRLDMSEYMEKHAVSRIIGSPPGYVGYEEAGQLTEKVRRRPYSVILFDEIEKAHPDIMNILLQILDEGQITDAHGRRVNFANTVLVLTTNAGSGARGSGISGFGAGKEEREAESTLRALKEFLRPEFLNRLDGIICFRHLSVESAAVIAKIFLEEMKKGLAVKGIALTYTPAVCKFIAEQSFSNEYGARNVRRYVEEHVEDAAAEKLLELPEGIREIRLQMRTNGKMALTVQ